MSQEQDTNKLTKIHEVELENAKEEFFINEHGFVKARVTDYITEDIIWIQPKSWEQVEDSSTLESHYQNPNNNG